MREFCYFQCLRRCHLEHRSGNNSCCSILDSSSIARLKPKRCYQQQSSSLCVIQFPVSVDEAYIVTQMRCILRRCCLCRRLRLPCCGFQNCISGRNTYVCSHGTFSIYLRNIHVCSNALAECCGCVFSTPSLSQLFSLVASLFPPNRCFL